MSTLRMPLTNEEREFGDETHAALGPSEQQALDAPEPRGRPDPRNPENGPGATAVRRGAATARRRRSRAESHQPGNFQTSRGHVRDRGTVQGRSRTSEADERTRRYFRPVRQVARANAHSAASSGGQAPSPPDRRARHTSAALPAASTTRTVTPHAIESPVRIDGSRRSYTCPIHGTLARASLVP